MPSQAELRTWMDIALDEAMAALAAGEAPIGAVVLNSDGSVLGRQFDGLLVHIKSEEDC